MSIAGPVGRVLGHLRGDLKIFVHGARNLPNHATIGIMNPFICAQTRGEKRRSEIHHHGGINPNWNFTFNFPVDFEPNEIVRFEVFDKGAITEEVIAVAALEIKDLVIYHKVRRWYQLVHPHHAQNLAGEFEATIEFVGEGIELFGGGGAPVFAGGFAAAAPAPVFVQQQQPVFVDPNVGVVRQEEREIRREEREIGREERREEHRHHHHQQEF